MADRTSIEWTDTTWNPTTGCDRISPGCGHCYAATMARRLKAMGHVKYQTDGHPATSGPGFALTLHPATLAVPYRWRTPRRVFVNSMSDLSGGVLILNGVFPQARTLLPAASRARRVSGTWPRGMRQSAQQAGDLVDVDAELVCRGGR